MEYTIVLPSNTRIVSEEENKGVYEIEGLYPGYGNTLGNSLRRIILSSLPGAAVTKVKIEGVDHEFSAVPGILEDMVAITLNFKQLRFRMHGEESQTATIDVKSAREIKGKDVKCPTQLEVVNPDHHLATITEKGVSFKAEITVEKGIGFVPAEELMKDKTPVGALVLDATFSPIRRANFEVENMRVGDRTDYNRVVLTVETDGSLRPKDALRQALDIIKVQFERISVIEKKVEAPAKIQITLPEAEEEKAGGLEGFNVSARTKNALSAAGINSPEALADKTEEELLSFEGVGDKAVGEIKKALKKIGLSLKLVK